MIAALAVFALSAPANASTGAADVVRATLPNGLKVAIVRDPVAPVVTVELNYLVGSDDTPPDFPGMAHAQEHMMFRGSPGLSADQLTAIVAELGGSVNADTRETVTQFHCTVPADDLELPLRIEAIRMRAVSDDQASWERERGAIEQEVSMDESSPAYLIDRAIVAGAFAGTPYARDGLGTRPSFDKTTAAMLKSFNHDWYVPNNAILVIAGDVDPPAALSLVQSLFGSIPARPTPAHQPVELEPLHDARVSVDANFAFPLTFVGYRLPGYDSPDFVAGQLLADVLRSKRGALATLVAQGRALDAEFDERPPLPKAGLGYAIAVSGPQTGRSSMSDTLVSIMDTYARNGVPDELIDAAKRREMVQDAEDHSSVSLVAQAWSEALAVGGRNSPDDDVARISSVTAADVDRVAKRYLAAEQAIVVDVRPNHEASGGGPVSTESFAPTDTKPTQLPQWAETKLSTLVVPPSLPAPDDETLPNGIRLIVQTETETPSVEVFGEVKTAPSVEAPQGQEGVAKVENDLFAFGTMSMDRVQFQSALDEIGADETSGTTFSVQMLAADFDRGLQLLADNELHPSFPSSAFGIVQQQDEGISAGRHRSAAYQVQNALDRALYPLFDPALRDDTPDTIASLTLDDVKDYYKKTFRPDLCTIVVIGDVTPAQASTEVEKWFGEWNTYDPPPSVDLPSVPDNDPASQVFSPVGDLQDEVSMSETIGLVRSNKDFYALTLGNEVLAGETLASRLYEDLRERRGLVYFVQSSLDIGDTRSTYTLRFGCDPANVSRARELMRADEVAMQTSPLSADDLQRAKALLIRQIPLAEASEEDIGRGLLARSVENIPLAEPTLAAAQYVALTPDDVMHAFAKWIRPDGFVSIVEGPYPR
jgi:zinc protease